MSQPDTDKPDMKLFWACFIALVATSFVFGVRSACISELADVFHFNETRKGEILGVGLWPFALSIIAFSLIIDRIGYKTAAFFAALCHLAAITVTLMAKNDTWLYWGTFIVAIGNGTVEAFINPVVATLFKKDKAKWLNILHAGWPCGIALGVIFSLLVGKPQETWQLQFGLCFVPIVLYVLLIIPRSFPVQERVAAGVSYREMLGEVGGLGFLMIGWLFVVGVDQLAGNKIGMGNALIAAAVIAVAAWIYTRSLGNPLFLVILLTMGPLATTELGTDTWMPDLLKFEFGSKSAVILAYSAIIMTILRAYAGPIVHKLSPIGLLVVSGMVAIMGLLFFSQASGLTMVVCAATVYALGKTFLWSTTLGMVSEQFPKGGALTLNGVSAVGVLGMGILGSVAMGYFQDTKIDADLKPHTAIYKQVAVAPKPTLFGMTPGVDADKVKLLSEAERKTVEAIQAEHRRGSFARVAVLPGFMLVCYLGIFLWFKARGGYKPLELGSH